MKYQLLLAALLIANIGLAAEPAANNAPRVEVQQAERSGLQILLDEMWTRLRAYGPKLSSQDSTPATVVAGVRGAESTASSLTPYWKGDKTRDPAFVAEVNAFSAAQTLAEHNDVAGASAAFEKFLKEYPASSLRPNAEFGLALAVCASDRAKGVAQLQAFVDKYPAHPLTADGRQAIRQLRQ